MKYLSLVSLFVLASCANMDSSSSGPVRNISSKDETNPQQCYKVGS